MSFIDSIVGFGKQALGFVKSPTLGGSLARSAILGLLLNQVQKSANKSNDEPVDPGVKETVSINTENSIPVLYGDGFTSGIITDAKLDNNNRDMWYCVTLSEKTGTILSTSTDSTITLKEIYRNGRRLELGQDGITVDRAFTDDGDITDNYSGLIKVYYFNNGSTNPATVFNEINANTSNAYDIMPHWSSTDTMNNLAFVIIKLTYNTEKKVTTFGDWTFRVSNDLYKSGDVLYDYMTNNQYGAGIPVAEINVT
jgi:hypothetical protein|tara:strand:+ start:1001 stop:1762 length:762 start_codon:yes stop_codon:yes gene_type:complete